MKFQIGDEVEITGQNVHNNSCRLGQTFVIEQIIIDKKYGTMYSAPGQLGFPADSLRLVEEPLKIGDCVRSIEPKYEDVKFRLVGYDEKHDAILSVTCNPWFLEKIEEPLKVGDIVEVIGNPEGILAKAIGQRLPIEETNTNSSGKRGYYVGGWWYSASSLRKLSPEEVAMHIGTIGYKINECQEALDNTRETLGMPQVSEIGKIHERLNWLQDQIDALTEASDARFSAIDKRLDAQRDRMNRIEDDMITNDKLKEVFNRALTTPIKGTNCGGP